MEHASFELFEELFAGEYRHMPVPDYMERIQDNVLSDWMRRRLAEWLLEVGLRLMRAGEFNACVVI